MTFIILLAASGTRSTPSVLATHSSALLRGLAEHCVWRDVSLAVAISSPGVAPLVTVLMRNQPEDVGLRADGETGTATPLLLDAPLLRPTAGAAWR